MSKKHMAAVRTVILDGGMGRELQRRGAPFRQPEWSALALSEAPQAGGSGTRGVTSRPVPT